MSVCLYIHHCNVVFPVVLEDIDLSAELGFSECGYQEQCQDYPPSLFLESWWLMINLEKVLNEWEYPSESSVKVSSISIVRNCVKTPPILQVTSWSLRGQGGS